MVVILTSLGIALGISIGIILLVFWIVSWSVCLYMTKDNTTIYGWGTYKQFKKEFAKHTWKSESWGGTSLFDAEADYLGDNYSQTHADIIEFNGKGMLMRTPVDYLLMKLFIYKYKKQNGMFKTKIKNYKW